MRCRWHSIGWRWRCVPWVSKASEHGRGCSLFGRLTVRILLRRVLLESDELLVLEHQAKSRWPRWPIIVIQGLVALVRW